ncbi:MAG: hypothetical protein EA379_10800 [Phycisphaerales bacterium]|nr:MAG: hypothetical protein EA379_10800 [Phycisphaerales bacterium]
MRPIAHPLTTVLLCACVFAVSTASAPPAAGASLAALTENEHGFEVRVYDLADVPHAMAKEIIGRLAEQSPTHLAAGMWLLTEAPETHAHIREALRQVRALRSERIGVEVSLRRAPRAEASVRIGDVLDAQAARIVPLRTVQVAGVYGEEINASTFESVTFLAEVTPVVGSQSSGAAPTIQTAHTGMRAVVTIGRPEDGRAVSAKVRGEYGVSRVSDGATLHGQVSHAPDTKTATLERVATMARPFESEVAVTPDAHTVFAVFDDPEHADGVLIATVRVRTLD